MLEHGAGLLPDAPDAGPRPGGSGPIRESGQRGVEIVVWGRRVGQDSHGDGKMVQKASDGEPRGSLPVDAGAEPVERGMDLVAGPGRVEGREGLSPAAGRLVQLDGQPVVQGGHVGCGDQERVQQPPVAPRVERLLMLEPREGGPGPAQVGRDVGLVLRRARPTRLQEVPDELDVHVTQGLLQRVELGRRGRDGRGPGPARPEEAEHALEGGLERWVGPDRRAQRLEPLQLRGQERAGQEALEPRLRGAAGVGHDLGVLLEDADPVGEVDRIPHRDGRGGGRLQLGEGEALAPTDRRGVCLLEDGGQERLPDLVGPEPRVGPGGGLSA